MPTTVPDDERSALAEAILAAEMAQPDGVIDIGWAENIAAAVAAHMLDPATEEIGARAAWRYEGGPDWETCGDNYRALYRAAIAAILGDAPGGRAQEGGENG